jgi:hypothetical protein
MQNAAKARKEDAILVSCQQLGQEETEKPSLMDDMIIEA